DDGRDPSRLLPVDPRRCCHPRLRSLSTHLSGDDRLTDIGRVAHDFQEAFLYWYEGTSTGTYSVKGAMSDGVGRWSAPVTLGGPWPGSATFTAMGQPGNDYLKGVYLSGQDMVLATWLQPDSGATRVGQAAGK